MKQLIVFFVLIGLLFINSSCEKIPNHRLRVRNNYNIIIHNLKIGDMPYGSVDFGITTSYHSITEGRNTISGTTPNNEILSGEITVEGEGKHSWTLTLLPSGNATLEED